MTPRIRIPTPDAQPRHTGPVLPILSPAALAALKLPLTTLHGHEIHNADDGWIADVDATGNNALDDEIAAFIAALLNAALPAPVPPPEPETNAEGRQLDDWTAEVDSEGVTMAERLARR